MTLTLSDEQLEEVQQGRPISVRSSEVREPLVVCPQSEFAAVIFAVKPQALDAVAPAYRRFAADSVFLSIAAGRTISSLQRCASLRSWRVGAT